jgi:hypothetical protein
MKGIFAGDAIAVIEAGHCVFGDTCLRLLGDVSQGMRQNTLARENGTDATD